MWVVNNNMDGPGSVTKLRAADGPSVGTFPFETSPFGVAFDGASVWVVSRP